MSLVQQIQLDLDWYSAMGHGMNKDTNPMGFEFTFRFASNAQLEPFDWNLGFPASLEFKLNFPTGIQ